MSITTSLMTAPVLTVRTVPLNWFRALSMIEWLLMIFAASLSSTQYADLTTVRRPLQSGVFVKNPGGELVSTGQVDGKVACRGCQAASLNAWRKLYMPTL